MNRMEILKHLLRIEPGIKVSKVLTWKCGALAGEEKRSRREKRVLGGLQGLIDFYLRLLSNGLKAVQWEARRPVLVSMLFCKYNPIS
jgi:hypothetical protein